MRERNLLDHGLEQQHQARIVGTLGPEPPPDGRAQPTPIR
jgi:hypothetical protein